MALKITYINEQAPAPKVRIDERLWETADGKRLVPDGHEDAAVLFCAPGHEVLKSDFERFELDKTLGKLSASGVEAPEAAEPAAEGEAAAAAEEPAPAEGEAEAQAKAENPKRGRPGAKATKE